MFTKEQLLAKGVTPQDADEIIASTAAGTIVSPIDDLAKALNQTDESVLVKAKGGEGHAEPDDDNKGGKSDDDDDNKGYDEEYMRKYMKKFMKDNKKECAKAAEEAGINEKELNKAIDDINRSVNGAIVEMEDLNPFLQKQSEFNAGMLKALEFIGERIDLIAGQHAASFDLLTKAASVDLEIARSIDLVSAQPTGRKGVTAISADLAKANQPVNEVLAYQTLMKAVHAKDRRAGEIVGLYESSGRKLAALSQKDREYINQLITEGK
jgi:hypothetical protein